MTWTTRPRSDYPDGVAGVVAGDGPPLVLLHGVGLNADSWGAQLGPLAERWTVHALDLPGHGASAPLGPAPSLADYTGRMAAAIASLGRPVRLAGHSLGALIALDLTVRHPALVTAVAALNAVHRRTPEAVAAVKARADAMSAQAANDPSSTLARWFGEDRHDAGQDAPAYACERWLRDVDPASYKAAYTAFAAADSPDDEALSAIACPALFLTGGDEPNSTPAMTRTMAARVPGGRAVIVDGAAHMAMMTHADAVNAALLAFFGDTP